MAILLLSSARAHSPTTKALSPPLNWRLADNPDEKYWGCPGSGGECFNGWKPDGRGGS
jgi:hypothetical protein